MTYTNSRIDFCSPFSLYEWCIGEIAKDREAIDNSDNRMKLLISKTHSLTVRIDEQSEKPKNDHRSTKNLGISPVSANRFRYGSQQKTSRFVFGRGEFSTFLVQRARSKLHTVRCTKNRYVLKPWVVEKEDFRESNV